MKRLAFAMVLLGLIVGTAAVASAATIKASGQWGIEFLLCNNFDYNSVGEKNNGGAENGDGDFNVYQRLRTQFDFIANENLRGVLNAEIGTYAWGQEFRFHDHSGTIGIRRAYIDFKIPETKVVVRGGLQSLDFPHAFANGSMILSTESPAMVVSAPIADAVSVTAGYSRLEDFDPSTAYTSGSENTAFDLGFLTVPVKLDGVQFTPFAVYGYAGSAAMEGMQKNADQNDPVPGIKTPGMTYTSGRSMYWLGSSFTMDYLDPFKLFADVSYGSVHGAGTAADKDINNRDGWMFDLAVDYTGLDFMTPEAFFVYTSGEDSNTKNGSERMPMLVTRTWAAGSFFFGGGYLLNSDTGFKPEQLGFWTAGLSLKDISFVDKLRHTVTVMYIQGTNDKELAGTNALKFGQSLTTADNLWEFDVNSYYKIYDELTLSLELGYINNNYDSKRWGSATVDPADGYKLSTGLMYSF